MKQSVYLSTGNKSLGFVCVRSKLPTTVNCSVSIFDRLLYQSTRACFDYCCSSIRKRIRFLLCRCRCLCGVLVSWWLDKNVVVVLRVRNAGAVVLRVRNTGAVVLRVRNTGVAVLRVRNTGVVVLHVRHTGATAVHIRNTGVMILCVRWG